MSQDIGHADVFPLVNRAYHRGPAKETKYMTRLMKKICLSLSILTLMPLGAEAVTRSESLAPFDWTPVMEAIIQVESGGNPNAVSGNSVGAMQITPICVKECNKILEKLGRKLRYSMNDRYDVKKSKEMFLLIQSYHNKTNNIEKAIRLWNGGPRYSVRATNSYYKKVIRCMK